MFPSPSWRYSLGAITFYRVESFPRLSDGLPFPSNSGRPAEGRLRALRYLPCEIDQRCPGRITPIDFRSTLPALNGEHENLLVLAWLAEPQCDA